MAFVRLEVNGVAENAGFDRFGMLMCNVCGGDRELADKNGWVHPCVPCSGSGFIDLEREVDYMKRRVGRG